MDPIERLILRRSPHRYFRMNGNANDSSGNAGHGTAAGGVLFDRVGVVRHSNDAAAYFDGVNDSIDLGAIHFGSSPFTVAMWVKPAVATDMILLGMDQAGDREFNVAYLSNQGFQIEMFGDSGLHIRSTDPGSVPVNAWSFIAASVNGASANLYINGSPVNYTTAGSASLPLTIRTSGQTMYLGRRAYSGAEQYFSGQMDEVAIYLAELSAAEIAAIYTLSQREASFAQPGNLSGGMQ